MKVRDFQLADRPCNAARKHSGTQHSVGSGLVRATRTDAEGLVGAMRRLYVLVSSAVSACGVYDVLAGVDVG